jgi:uncharacterized protein YecE (DUF72 family)
MAKAYIGTSGWTYKHWKEPWYGGIPQKRWLEFMAERMTGLEANGTFYRLPKRESMADWAQRTPADFRFAAKAHRYLTHNKKLKNIAEGIEKQREAFGGLEEKLVVVVWQLPDRFVKNVERLESFIHEIGAWPETRHTVEFRDDSWFTDEVAAMLSEAGIAVCMSDASRWPMWERVTTDFAYVRLHGHDDTYVSSYTDEQLWAWAEKTRIWLAEGRDVHIYFDNDVQVAAPWNAMKLLELLG